MIKKVNKLIRYNFINMKNISVFVQIVVFLILIVLSKGVTITVRHKFVNEVDCYTIMKGLLLLITMVTILYSVYILSSFYTSKEKEFLSTLYITKIENMCVLFSKVKYTNIFSSILFASFIYEWKLITNFVFLHILAYFFLFYINLYLIEVIISIFWDRIPFKDIGIIVISLIILYVLRNLNISFKNELYNKDFNAIIGFLLKYIGGLKGYNFFLKNILLNFSAQLIIALLNFIVCYFISYKNIVSINMKLVNIKLPKLNFKKLFYRKSLYGYLIKDMIMVKQMKIMFIQVIIYCPIALYSICNKFPGNLIFAECIAFLVLNSIGSSYIFSMEEEYINLIKSLSINEKMLIKHKFTSMYIFSTILPILILILSLFYGIFNINDFLIYFIIVELLSLIYTVCISNLCYVFFMRIQKSMILAVLAYISYAIPPLAIILTLICIRTRNKLKDIEV